MSSQPFTVIPFRTFSVYGFTFLFYSFHRVMSWPIDYDIPRNTVLSFWFRWCLYPDTVSEPSESLCYNLRPHQTPKLLHDQLRPDHEPLRSFPGAAPSVHGLGWRLFFQARLHFTSPPSTSMSSQPFTVIPFRTFSFNGFTFLIYSFHRVMSWSLDHDIPRRTVIGFWFWWCL